MKRAIAALAIAACSAPYQGGRTPAWVSETGSYSSPAMAPRSGIAERYGEVAQKIITHARADRGAYTKLEYLTDRIGNRLAGSPALDRAIEWSVKSMKDDGLDARAEKVMVPHWVRGNEDASIVTPVERPIKMIGLGGSVGTPKGGITAKVVVVESFDELEAKAAQIKGSIVLYNVAMPAYSEVKGSGYGETAQYRGRGPSRAAKLGAVAVLVRSVTAHSLRTPHTGALRYDDKLPKIPAAAVTVEDALLIARLAAKEPVTVKLRMDAQMLPDVASANVLGELKGKDKPDEIVVIGAHIDSWDVGQGANDDGAGCVIVMQALATLKRLGLQPRRTIRVVLFTNEESGLAGARAYAKDHEAELAKHVMALETDSGSFAPKGFSVETKDPKTVERYAEIAALLAPINATRVRAGGSGADLIPMVAAGVTGVGLDVDGKTYFDTHHTEADTFDKVDPQTLADNVAAVAVLAYIVADSLISLLESLLVMRGEPLRPLDAIVVLGATLVRDRMTPPLVERVEAAAQLYHAGGAPIVIATGGVTRGASRSEAAAMAEGLRARGVPEVLVEERSQSTAENAIFTAALLRDARRVWLVTQPFHGRRAARLFRNAGCDAHVWHIADSVEYRDRRRAARWIVREYAAWAALLLRGR